MNVWTVILIVAALIIFFLLLREFWCWYSKRNQTIEILKEILEELKTKNNTEK